MDTVKDLFNTVKNKVTSGNNSLVDLPDIERSIINPSAAIGSLYDARDDSIQRLIDENIQSKKEKICKQYSSVMYKGENIQIENLLKIIKIDNETRLSTILKLIEPNGIVSILNYSHLIDNLTRLIYYFEIIEEELLIYEFLKHKNVSVASTHFISKIQIGISFIIILQLSSSPTEELDNQLEYFTSKLNSDIQINEIISNQKKFLKNFSTTKIYSNLNRLSQLNNICELYEQFQLIRKDSNQYRPLSFTLTPINQLYQKSNLIKNYISINEKYITDIEIFILPFSFYIKTLKKDFKYLKTSLLTTHLQCELDHAAALFEDFQSIYSKYLETLSKAVIKTRSGKMSEEKLVELLNTEEKELLLKKKKDIRKYFNHLKSKNLFIIELQDKQIEYLNVFNININKDDNQQTLQRKLINHKRNIHVLCSNDDLRDEDNQSNEQINKFIESRKNKNNSRLIYADFSYSSYNLEKIQIISSKKNKVIGQSKNSQVKNETKLNIVLFGESGVGKSTFINAFANYLLYENIDKARSDEPIVIIPVSFLITINDQFDERLIEFGNIHSNENHNDLGQSVTQQCKTYEFSTSDGNIINIIDTPGFGDTRGQEQDEINLKEIFSYIKNLKHLNALCILLKPNVKELNPSFKTSFRQILQFLGDEFTKNIFFCFTNSQSTFFSVGDTGPILNKFIQSYQINLNKENTFCFDSESFRYLVASSNSIKFDQMFIQQFEQSWIKSVKESNRLIKQIFLQEKQININQKWISNDKIKQQIIYLIRPMLEAIRNIFRNIILSDNETFNRSIQLISIPLESPKLICYKLDRSYQTFGEFNILSDYFHQSSIQCEYEHLMTNYKLDYRYILEKTDYLSEDANTYLYGIIKACAHFDYFLDDNNQTSKKDGPFISGINRMIQEEKSICEREEQPCDFNKKLANRLKKSIDQYMNDLEKIDLGDEYLYLESIYSRIEGIKQMPMIYEQLNHDQQTENDK